MTVFEKVKIIIVEQLSVNESDVVAEANFVNDLGADSLDVVELMMALEEEYNINIDDDEFITITTVEKLVNFITEETK